MSFHKPQPLIYSARDFGEQIRRVGIIQFVRFIDRVAGFLTKGRKCAGHTFDMRHAFGNFR